MRREQLFVLAGALLRGFGFFAVVMGLAMGAVMLNARWSPEIVWFPVPAIAVLVVATGWAERRWDIGLRPPAGLPWWRVCVVGIAVTLLGISVCVVQGAFTGMVRQTELFRGPVGPSFALSYAILMAVFAGVLAEVAFRGVVQSRMQPVLGAWPTVIIVAAVNVVSHRWGPEILGNWLGLFVTLAGWTWLRWWSQSLWPPLLLHAVLNLLVATGLWIGGPFDHALLGTGVVVGFTILGLAAFGAAVAGARNAGPAKPVPA
jgi:membrane protease YdiL (CAAX protease family)